MRETSYAQRLAEALGVPEEKSRWSARDRARAKELADALGVSPQAIDKYFRDASNAMSAINNSRAARFLRVDPDWLATGEGSMRGERAWPFGKAILPLDFFQLDAEDVQPAIDVLTAAIARRRASGKQRDAA